MTLIFIAADSALSEGGKQLGVANRLRLLPAALQG
jgi:hypothetical protein